MMRWNGAKVARVVMPVALVVLSPVIAVLWAAFALTFASEKVCGWIARPFRHPDEPHPWFAWRPVAFSLWCDDYGDHAWLTTVWRARNRYGETVYASSFENIEAAL